MGNSGSQAFVEPLSIAMKSNRYPVVREHCAWALGKLGGPEAVAALETLLNEEDEGDEAVRNEARLALNRAKSP